MVVTSIPATTPTNISTPAAEAVVPASPDPPAIQATSSKEDNLAKLKNMTSDFWSQM